MRLCYSGINPGDTKKREGYFSSTMAYPRVVPHSDGAGLIDQLGACLGIPGVTAHRAVFADGPVAGQTVLVQGALGAVGSLAAQLVAWAGGRVITTVRRTSELSTLTGPAAERAVALDVADPAAAARDGALSIATATPYRLDEAAAAHDQVDSDNRRRVLLAIPD